MAAQQFHDYADEHCGWAETAKTDRERSIFLQMAAAWLDIAEQWEVASSTRSELPSYRPPLTGEHFVTGSC